MTEPIATTSTFGPTGVPVYPSLSALAADQQRFVSGTIVNVQSPSPTLYQAAGTASAGTYATTSTAVAAYGGATVYWVPVVAGGGSAQGTVGLCRNLLTTVHAYTGSGTGTLTSTANGPLSTASTGVSSDTVQNVAGDQVFIQAGTANVTAKDSGPWVVVQPGVTAVSPWILTRPAWWITGTTWRVGQVVRIGPEGYLFANTEWKVYGNLPGGTAALSGLVDTNDPLFFVTKFAIAATLTSGALSLAAGPASSDTAVPLVSGACNFPVGIYSLGAATGAASALSIGGFTLGGTNTSTVSFNGTLVTAGYVGTAAALVKACAAGMGTATGDASTLIAVLVNP